MKYYDQGLTGVSFSSRLKTSASPHFWTREKGENMRVLIRLATEGRDPSVLELGPTWDTKHIAKTHKKEELPPALSESRITEKPSS